LPPWPDGDRGGREPDDCPSATVGLLEARGLSGVDGCGRAGRDGAGSEAVGRLLAGLAEAGGLSGQGIDLHPGDRKG